MTPRFTPEQAAAIADRSGSRLLSANAGSGKTAVMVERFVEAVVADGIPVGSILAITFTEKAAGELRERIRGRFAALGRVEEARAADGAWIGTIHGFCARVLRTQSLAAGLDPRFSVLDEAAAARVSGGAFAVALEDWAQARGAAAIDLAAAYGHDQLRGMVLGVHAALRSAGQTQPRLPKPSALPDVAAARSALLGAARTAAAELAALPKNGAKVAAALAALAACEEIGTDPVPLPHDLTGLDVGAGANALRSDACNAYRAALERFRHAAASHHAAPALALLDDLLTRHAAAYSSAKRSRAAVDFEDLELGVRDLFAADPALRGRWRERFSMVMVDEFQDTNRVQIELLHALEDNDLFAVGDEFQGIYGFRHADVDIFRERRAALGDAGNCRLTANFRSVSEILDVLNVTFAPLLGDAFSPLVPDPAIATGADGHNLRLFDPGGAAGAPAVDVLVTGTGWAEHERALGLDLPGSSPERRAEARLVAQRLREEVDGGRPAGDLVVLVRATASLGLYEQALEEAGLGTYVVGGRGYWAQEQVRDGLAYLRAIANPLDEEALFGVLSSPFCGVGADALVLLAAAGRDAGGAWAALRAGRLEGIEDADVERLEAFAELFAAERARASRLPVEVVLERAVSRTGYDLAVLARTGGERRLANLRKLMRLASEYEATEGRDLRGFLAHAATQDMAQAREGLAALESEGLDAVRLMTIHRAKGLQFGVVAVADLGRSGMGGHPNLLVHRDGRVGLVLRTLGGGRAAALDHPALAREREEAEAAEERRLLYVAMTRAQERLIVSGTCDLANPPRPRHGGAPLAWLLPALLGDVVLDEERPDRVVDVVAGPHAGQVRLRLNTPASLGAVLSAPAPVAAVAVAVAAGDLPAPAPALALAPPPVPRPVPRRLSYSQLSAYGRCGYRYYLERVLRLPTVAPPLLPGLEEAAAQERLDPRVRGTLAHRLLEALDFASPSPPSEEELDAVAAEAGVTPTAEERADVRALVAAFAASPLCARLAAATDVRREPAFAFVLDAPGDGPLLTGFLDVVAREADGTLLVVDYKTDRLHGADPREAVARDYSTQQVVYALAGFRAGAPRVEVAYCFLERPEVAVAETFDDPDALVTALAGLAEGVLAERWEVTPDPHRGLCADCPGRARLCAHDESLTLRDYASAESPRPH